MAFQHFDEGEVTEARTHAFFTSSSFRGPEALNPRANLSGVKSEPELSNSDEES